MTLLEKIRNHYSLTRKELAEILGVTTNYIWKIENKERRLGYSLAKKLKKILHKDNIKITLEEILDNKISNSFNNRVDNIS